MLRRYNLRCYNGGFTLVEVLVALFVLAVGVLGAAATGLGATRQRQQAALESEAVQLAASLGERMRVNPGQAALPGAANPYLVDYEGAGGAPAPPPVQCHASACDPAQLARFDLYETASVVHAAFPGGRLVVCRDSGAWNAALGRLDWRCSGGAGAPIVVKLGWRPPAAAGIAASADGATPFITLTVAR